MDDGHVGEDAKDWTKSQSDQITSLYKSLKGNYQKIADKELFGGPQLPYDKAHGILTELLEKQEHNGNGGGLENTIKGYHSKKPTPLLDLSALAATAGLFAIAPPAGILAGALYLMSKYQSKTKAAHP